MLVSTTALAPQAKHLLIPTKYIVKFSFVSTVVDGVKVYIERIERGHEMIEPERPQNALGDHPASMGFRREHYVRLPRHFQNRIFSIREAQMIAAEADAEREKEREIERDRDREEGLARAVEKKEKKESKKSKETTL